MLSKLRFVWHVMTGCLVLLVIGVGFLGTFSAQEDKLKPECLGKDEAFLPYIDILTIYCDDTFMYIEANTLADHQMMVGITAWNQQVPIPQDFTEANAWKIPLYPAFSGTTTATPGQGPMAVAINGVMMYNPTRQDGIYAPERDPYLTGELDVCGGHSGRADDYHYHIAPNCLLEELSSLHADSDYIIAYALDGFPIYAYDETLDTTLLDECGGEFDASGAYHYRARPDYPYLNGCFKGTFDSTLQPYTQPIRPAGEPIQVIISAYYDGEDGWAHLEYEYQGTLHSLNYRQVDSGCYEFKAIEDVNASTEGDVKTYCAPVNVKPSQGTPPEKPAGPPPTPTSSAFAPTTTPIDSNGFVVTSVAFENDGILPTTFTCDGDSMSPPLAWSNAPLGTVSYAITMHHIPGPGDTHVYWVVYNIPATVTQVEAGSTAVGTFGINTVNGQTVYAPPCSKGPGLKAYTLTVYALSANPEISVASNEVTMETLVSAIQNDILAAATLTVSYERSGQ